MKNKNRINFIIAGGLLTAFVLWTVAIRFIDVKVIGPQGSRVGFATVNEWFHHLTGVHMQIYTLTDWLGLVPVGVMLAFALLGLVQWVRRKSLFKVDTDILLLGLFYLLVLGAYMLFERVVINYRPLLINDFLEASYPSSTTLLVLCVMPTAMMELHMRIRHHMLRRWGIGFMGVFTLFMVLGRLLSGVHWVTDIIGGVLLSGGLVMGYRGLFLICHSEKNAV